MKTKTRILIAAGTRPELIKLAPVYKVLKSDDSFEVFWLDSFQHRGELETLYEFFGVQVDFSLDLASLDQPGSSRQTQAPNSHSSHVTQNDSVHLCNLASNIVLEASKLFEQENFDLLIVQGDTMTAQQTALAAFYHKIPLAHVEAGLRTYDLGNPFPEELARNVIDHIANLRFAPTYSSYINLEREDSQKHSPVAKAKNFLVGNTVVDALQYASEQIDSGVYNFNPAFQKLLGEISSAKSSGKKVILLTAHRRENMVDVHKNLLLAMKRLIRESSSGDLDFMLLIPLHKNPEIRRIFAEQGYDSSFCEEFSDVVKIVEPLEYPECIKLMTEVDLILTDSGGIQEEAPYLETPVLIFRQATERTESLDAGVARLIGPDEETFYASIEEQLSNPDLSMIQKGFNAYGSGDAAEKIRDHLLEYFALSKKVFV